MRNLRTGFIGALMTAGLTLGSAGTAATAGSQALPGSLVCSARTPGAQTFLGTLTILPSATSPTTTGSVTLVDTRGVTLWSYMATGTMVQGAVNVDLRDASGTFTGRLWLSAPAGELDFYGSMCDARCQTPGTEYQYVVFDFDGCR